MSWSECMWPKLVSADSRQTVIAVGCDDVSMQQEDFFIPEQYTPLGGQEGREKNTSLYKIKLLFPPESQKNDRNNTPFMVLDSRGRKLGMFYMLFSYSYTPLLTSAENPGILMFKK